MKDSPTELPRICERAKFVTIRWNGTLSTRRAQKKKLILSSIDHHSRTDLGCLTDLSSYTPCFIPGTSLLFSSLSLVHVSKC